MRRACPSGLLAFAALALPLASVAIGQAPPARDPLPPAIGAPRTPDQAKAEFRIDPVLRLELVAAEPEVQSPVAMSFDDAPQAVVYVP